MPLSTTKQHLSIVAYHKLADIVLRIKISKQRKKARDERKNERVND
jgi:hypothetical protein